MIWRVFENSGNYLTGFLEERETERLIELHRKLDINLHYKYVKQAIGDRILGTVNRKHR